MFLLLYLTLSFVSSSYCLIDVDSLPGLICYQCESDSTNDSIVPYCYSSYIRAAPDIWKEDSYFQCTYDSNAYCVKLTTITSEKTTTATDVVDIITKRGCVGSKDASGNRLRNGCQVTIDKKQTICLCSTKLCNSIAKVRSNDFLFYTFSFIYFVWNEV